MRKFLCFLFATIAVLTVAIALRGNLPQVATGTWVSAGALNEGRAGAASVLLPDGRLLIIGGRTSGGTPIAAVEAFNPDGSVSPVAPMNAARAGHAAIWLMDGVVLVTGGRTSGGGVVNSAEIYDPLTNTWTVLPASMVEARAGHSAVQLLDGSVLLVGGENSSGAVAAVERFDLVGETFSFAGALIAPRTGAAVAALDDGRVFIAGGSDASGAPLASTEIYDPSTGAMSAGPALATARAGASATALRTGTVLVAGGNNGEADLASAEMFDGTTGTISTTGAMSTARTGHLAFLLPNNNGVLLVGGTSAGQTLASADLYLPWTGQFRTTGAMAAPRTGATGSPLQVDGRLVVAGGNQASVELYGFATLKTDQTEYAPGQTVIASGSGWQPGETVQLLLHKVEDPAADKVFLATADAFGNIVNSDYTTSAADYGAHFDLTATGSVSQAQIGFKDATSITSVSVTTGQVPNPVAPGSSATYAVAITRTGNGGLSVSLSVTGGLPTGASASFSPNPVVFSGNTPAMTSTLTVNTNAATTPPGTSTFTIQAVGGATRSTTTTLTVAGTAPSVTSQPGNQSITYGQNASFNASASGSPAPAVQWQSSTNGGATWGDIPGAASTTYTVVTPSVSQSGTQYRAVFSNGSGTATSNAASLTVAPAPLTITAGDSSRIYGAGNPPFNVTYSGFVDGDTAASLSGMLTFTTAATSASPVGSYPVTPGGLSSTNYTITFAPGTLSVTPASLAVTADDKSRGYGISNPAFTASFSGFVNGDTAAVVSGAPACSTTATSSSPLGTYPITCTAGTLTATNYNFSTFNPGTMTVTAVPLTVTATDQSRPYGSSNGPLTGTITGVVSGDDISATYATTATAASPVGTYAIVPTLVDPGNKLGNYTVTVNNGALTISAAPLTVGVAPATKTYGAANPAFTATYNGFVSGDTEASLSGTLTFATAATAASPVGSYPVTPGGLTSSNYTITFAPGTLSVTPAPLSVTADDKSRGYGISNPAFTAGFSGFLNGDTAAVVGGSAACSTTATTASAVGTYPITCTAGTLAATNYNFATFNPGTLTVTSGTLTITADDKSRTYGAGNPALTYTLTGFVNGDDPSVVSGAASCSTTATASSAAGAYGIHCAQGTLSAVNYNFTSVDGTLTVTKATPVVTIPDGSPNPSVYGQTVAWVAHVAGVAAAPTGTVTWTDGSTEISSGSVSPTGDSSLSASSLTVGPHSITATYGGDANYLSASFTVPQTVNKASTAVALVSSANPAAAGTPITFTATVSVTAPGSGTPTGTVTFWEGTAMLGTGTLDGSGQAALTTSVLSPGTHDITAQYSGDTNLNANTSAPVSQSVTRITPVVTWSDPASITYGTGLSATQLNAAATFNGSAVDGTYVYTPASGTVLSAGMNQALSVTFHPTDPVYDTISATVRISVAPATLLATGVSTARLYGDPNPAFTVTYSGFVNGDGPSVLTTAAACTSTAVAASAISPPTYPITCSGAAAANYVFTYAPGALTINPAPLTVTPSNASRPQGQPNPPLTGAITGIKNGDPITATYTTTALQSSPVGAYPITVAAVSDGGTGKLANYTVNSSATATLTITAVSDRPDLTAAVNALSTATPAVGVPFTVTDTTTNQGGASAAVSYTRYYLSLNQTKEPGDLLLTGNRSMSSLAAGASSTATATITVPVGTALGTYYVLACADDFQMVTESDETNNCALGQVQVTLVPADLVATVTATGGTPAVGGSFTITDTTQNQGGGTAGGSYTRYYLSLNQNKDGSDILLTGNRSIANVVGGASSSGTATLTVPLGTPLGTYYLLACADDFQQVSETSEANNCAPGTVQVTVAGSDLVASVTTTGGTPAVGGSFTVSDTTTNQGPGVAGGSYTRYYLSLNQTKDAADMLLTGSRSLGTLAASASSSGTATVTVPAGTAPGTYYVLACADGYQQVTEANEANNCAPATAQVTVAGPDLVSTVTATGGTPAVGGTFTISDTTTNQGPGVAASSYTRYYLSLNQGKDGADILLTGNRSMATLAAGASSSGTTTLTVPLGTPLGTYYLLACADDYQLIGEENEANNCALGQIQVVITH